MSGGVTPGVTGREQFASPGRSKAEQAQIAAVEDVFDGFAKSDFSVLASRMAPEGSTWVVGFTPGRLGPAAANPNFIGDLFSNGMHFDIKAVATEGPVVFVEWEDEATTSGGKRYDNTGLSVFRFDDEGRIASYHEYLDPEHFFAVLS